MAGFGTETSTMFEGGSGGGTSTGGTIPPCIDLLTVIYADTASPIPQAHDLFLTSPVGWLISGSGCLIVQG